MYGRTSPSQYCGMSVAHSFHNAMRPSGEPSPSHGGSDPSGWSLVLTEFHGSPRFVVAEQAVRESWEPDDRLAAAAAAEAEAQMVPNASSVALPRA